MTKKTIKDLPKNKTSPKGTPLPSAALDRVVGGVVASKPASDSRDQTKCPPPS
jgi:hypothetical protein